MFYFSLLLALVSCTMAGVPTAEPCVASTFQETFSPASPLHSVDIVLGVTCPPGTTILAASGPLFAGSGMRASCAWNDDRSECLLRAGLRADSDATVTATVQWYDSAGGVAEASLVLVKGFDSYPYTRLSYNRESSTGFVRGAIDWGAAGGAPRGAMLTLASLSSAKLGVNLAFPDLPDLPAAAGITWERRLDSHSLAFRPSTTSDFTVCFLITEVLFEYPPDCFVLPAVPGRDAEGASAPFSISSRSGSSSTSSSSQSLPSQGSDFAHFAWTSKSGVLSMVLISLILVVTLASACGWRRTIKRRYYRQVAAEWNPEPSKKLAELFGPIAGEGESDSGDESDSVGKGRDGQAGSGHLRHRAPAPAPFNPKQLSLRFPDAATSREGADDELGTAFFADSGLAGAWDEPDEAIPLPRSPLVLLAMQRQALERSTPSTEPSPTASRQQQQQPPRPEQDLQQKELPDLQQKESQQPPQLVHRSQSFGSELAPAPRLSPRPAKAAPRLVPSQSAPRLFPQLEPKGGDLKRHLVVDNVDDDERQAAASSSGEPGAAADHAGPAGQDPQPKLREISVPPLPGTSFTPGPSASPATSPGLGRTAAARFPLSPSEVLRSPARASAAARPAALPPLQPRSPLSNPRFLTATKSSPSLESLSLVSTPAFTLSDRFLATASNNSSGGVTHAPLPPLNRKEET